MEKTEVPMNGSAPGTDADLLELVLEHMPEQYEHVRLGLFVNVVNASEVRQKIVEAALGDSDERRRAVDFAILDGRLVVSTGHLFAAVHAALVAASQGKLRTRTVHSEILYTLAPTKNITQSLKTFGPKDDSTALIMVKVGGVSDGPAVLESIKNLVQGDLVDMSRLPNVCDYDQVRDIYKLIDVTDPLILEKTLTGTVAAKAIS